MVPGHAILRPLAKVNPMTGRKVLYVNIHSFGVQPGLDRGCLMERLESRAFLDDLLNRAKAPPRNTYKHKWTEGDLILWDQRSMWHRSRPFPANEVRYVRGTRVGGDETDLGLEANEEVLEEEMNSLKNDEP